MRGSGVLVDHPPLNTGGPASDTEYLNNFGSPSWQRLADDFMLTEAAMIGHVRWWGFYHLDNPPAVETFRIRVYGARESDGLPDDGNVVLEQVIANPLRTATGRRVFTGVDPDEYVFDAALSQTFEALAGEEYWLEIVQVGDPLTRFRWEVSVAENNSHAFINEGVGIWSQSGLNADTAYQLIAVPEPATFGLFAFTLTMFFHARRRRA